MKSLEKLKLTNLSQAQLGRNEQNRLKGGANCCICGCRYCNHGGSSTGSNGSANSSGGSSGLSSPGGGSGSGSYG